MTQVNPVTNTDNYSNYSAVKIRVSEPRAFISGNNSSEDKGNYNAVDIAVDKPFLARYDHEIYNYPQYEEPVSSGMVIMNTEQNYYPVPAVDAYKNNDKIYIAEEPTNKQPDIKETENNTTVPEPNITTPEAEKKNLVYFNGTKKSVEIVPPEEITPSVDINKVVNNLSDKNYDVQAKQMGDITKIAMQKPNEAVTYIKKPVFKELISILKKDTSELDKPTAEQIEIRKKIILNEMVKEQAEQEGKKDVQLPYTLTEDEIKTALILSDYEQAERNKEYAVYTIAALDKVYVNETEKRTGNIIPLTDLPGIADITDILKTPDLNTKLVALEGLYYIRRPEYAEELKSVFSMATSDTNPDIANIAAEMMKAIDKPAS